MAKRPINPGGGDAPKILVRVTFDTIDGLDAEAKRRGVTRSDVVRDVLARALTNWQEAPLSA